MTETQYILGIDPGMRITGYGVIRVEQSSRLAGPSLKLVEAGIIRSKSKQPIEKRLTEIHAGVSEVFDSHPIQIVALEQLYSHYDRPRTAILMGHARGVLCLAAGTYGAQLYSYLPNKIKKTLTGNGHAPKNQMQLAIQQQLNLKTVPEPADVADALAAAICHVYSANTIAANA